MPPFESYQPPQGYEPVGDLQVNPPAELPFEVDDVVTQNSPNPISSGAVFEAVQGLQGKITAPSEAPEDKFLDGNFDFQSLSEKVQTIVEGMDLGGGTPEDPQSYITEAELTEAIGLAITAPLTLPAETATRYATYTKSIPRATFSLSTGNAAVSLVAAPAGCNVVIDTNTVAISWVPTFTGAHYVVFWVGNGKTQGQIASLKITVTAGATITPVGDLVQAGSSLAAGMLVNIYDDNGTPKMRPAIATALGTKAHAFVTGNAAAGGELVPRYEGINPHFTGLQAGKRYFLSSTVPGGISLFGPAQASGHVWQPVGVAISETELLLDIDDEVVLNGGT